MSRKTVTALCSTCLACGCSSVSGPSIIAHRGASHDAPENTVAAFALAWQQGADGIEGDYHLTRDGQVVCIHDATTKRTAGKTLKVAETSFIMLRELDVGSWKGSPWAGTRIPTIDEVLATVPNGKKVFLEIKADASILPALGKALAATLARPGQVVLMSFDPDVVAQAKKQFPRLTVLWLTDFAPGKRKGTFTPSVDDILATLKRTNADGVDCRAHAAVDQALVDALHADHREVHVWAVDDERTGQRIRGLGLESMTTNRPEWLRNLLRNKAKRKGATP